MHRAVLLLLLGSPLPATTLHAQRAHDEARLTIGVGVLYSGGGGSLWRVGRQPVLDAAGTDTLGISRATLYRAVKPPQKPVVSSSCCALGMRSPVK